MMKIVCIGDSLTEGLGVDGEKAWPAVLARKGNVEVLNRGISGDTTTGMVGRFSQDVISHQPSHVIIMGGGNDLWWDVSVNHILSNIYSMIKQTLYYQLTPLIGIPTPLYMDGIDHQSVWEPISGYGVFAEKQAQYITSLIQLAKDNGWDYIDFHRMFLDDHHHVKVEYFTGTDGVHPNEKGHHDMADLIVRSMRSRVS